MHALKALLHARASPPTSPSLGPNLGPNLGPAWSTSAPARGPARSSTGLVSGFVSTGLVSGFVEHSRQVEAVRGNLYTHMQSHALRGLMTDARPKPPNTALLDLLGADSSTNASTGAAAAAATTVPAAAAFSAADSHSTALQPSSSLPRLHVALPRAGAAPEIAGAAPEIASAAGVGAGAGAVLGAGAGPCACISMGGLSPSSRRPPEMQPPEEEMRWRSRARPPAPERARELHSRARNLNRISMLLADEMLQVGSNKADGVADGVHVKADGVAGAAGAGAGAGVGLGLGLGTGLVPGGGRAAGGGRLGSSISLPSLPSHGSHPISSDLHRISLPSVGAAHRVGERLAAHSRSHLAPSERLAARERTGLNVNAPRLPPRLHRHQV